MSKLLSLLKRRPELLLFGTVAVVYVTCCTPDFTWMNVNCDSFGLYLRARNMAAGSVYTADYVYQAVGHAALYIPLGSEVWRLTLFTATIPSILTSILIFFAVRKQTVNKWAPYVASIVFSGSVLILSQATVVEKYALATFITVLSYTLVVYDRYRLAVIVVAIAPFAHAVMGTLGVVFITLVDRNVIRKAWYVVAPVVMVTTWTLILSRGTEYWYQLLPLIGFAPTEMVPENILTMSAILAVSMGLGLIPLYLFLRNWRASYPFALVALIPIAFFFMQPGHESYVQSYLSVTLLSIAAGLGVDYVKWNPLPKLIAIVGCLMLLTMPVSWDIGRTLDESPTTARQFLTQIEQLPSGSVLLDLRLVDGLYDWHGILSEAGLEVVGRDDIRIVDPHKYQYHQEYREALQHEGYETPTLEYNGTHYSHYMQHIVTVGRVFAAANPTKAVYVVEVDRPETFGCKIVRL